MGKRVLHYWPVLAPRPSCWEGRPGTLPAALNATTDTSTVLMERVTCDACLAALVYRALGRTG